MLFGAACLPWIMLNVVVWAGWLLSYRSPCPAWGARRLFSGIVLVVVIVCSTAWLRLITVLHQLIIARWVSSAIQLLLVPLLLLLAWLVKLHSLLVGLAWWGPRVSSLRHWSWRRRSTASWGLLCLVERRITLLGHALISLSEAHICRQNARVKVPMSCVPTIGCWRHLILWRDPTRWFSSPWLRNILLR